MLFVQFTDFMILLLIAAAAVSGFVGDVQDIMRRRPRPSREGLLAGGIAWHIAWVGLLMAGVTLLTQALALGIGNDHWRTMVFTVLTLAQMWQVMGIRSGREPLFERGLLSNVPLLGAVLLTFALQLVVIYAPLELVSCISLSGVVLAALEIEKRLRRGLRREGARGPG